MKTRLLTLILLALALAVPATAFAMQCAPTVTGNKFSSKAATGTCQATKAVATAVLRCSGSGSAVVRYSFGLKDGCGPSVVPWVDAIGDPAYGSTLKGDDKVLVWVKTTGRSRVIVSTVSLRYYCK